MPGQPMLRAAGMRSGNRDSVSCSHVFVGFTDGSGLTTYRMHTQPGLSTAVHSYEASVPEGGEAGPQPLPPPALMGSSWSCCHELPRCPGNYTSHPNSQTKETGSTYHKKDPKGAKSANQTLSKQALMYTHSGRAAFLCCLLHFNIVNRAC